MQASQTQIDAFHSLSGAEKSAVKRKIIDVFGGDRSVTLTNDEIAARGKIGLSTVCGRVNEMVKDEILAERGTDRRPGRRCRQKLFGLPVEVAA